MEALKLKGTIAMEENTTDSEDIYRDIRITSGMIVVNIIMAALCCFLMIVISDHILTGILIGILAWALILFKTSVWDWTFISVKPNWVVILANQTTYDVVPPNTNDRTDVEKFPLRSMREVGPGIRGVFPWEVNVADINLQREIVIGNNEKNPLRCVTADELEVFIVWQVTLTPLRGYLVNFIRQDEKSIVAYFKGQFEQAIIKWVKGKNEGTIAADLTELHKAFKNVFGGPDEVHDQERKNGTFTNDPQIINYERNSAFQKAAQADKIAKNLNTVVGTINKSFAGGNLPDPNVILAAAAGLTGEALQGVLIIPGLADKNSDGVAAIAAAIKNQPKGKK